MRLPVALSLLLLSAPAFADRDAGLNQKLYEAVQYQDAAAVSKLLAEGADPNSVNSLGYTPLLRAVETGQAAIVHRLLEAGANTDHRDGDGRTAAELAVEADNGDVIEALLNAGADFNTADAYGNTLVLRVIQNEGEAMYETLAAFGRHGVNVNRGNSSTTPLYYAVEQDNADLVRALLEAGADPSLATESGNLPLIPALSNPVMLDLLLSAGADPNGIDRNGNPVLFKALFAVSADAAEALIAAGAKADMPGADGRTPLRRARDGGDQEAIELLKRHGAMEDGKKAAAANPVVPAPAQSAVPAGEAPAITKIPRYPGAQILAIQEQDNVALYMTSDALPDVAQVTRELVQGAGWKDAKHPHASQTQDRYYGFFTREGYVLIIDIAIARAMGNMTNITYSIVDKYPGIATR